MTPFSSRTMRPDDWQRIKHFRPSEFRHPEKMGFEFMLWLDGVRAIAGVPIVITSEWRSDDHNADVGGADDSAHMEVPCNAVDIGERPRSSDPGWSYSRWRIVTAAIEKGCKRIGTYANGSLHLDMTHGRRPSPRMWRIAR